MNSRLSLSDLRSNLHFAFPVTYRLMPKNIKKIKKNIIKYRKKSCLYLNEFVVFRDGKFPQIMICLAGEKPNVLHMYMATYFEFWEGEIHWQRQFHSDLSLIKSQYFYLSDHPHELQIFVFSSPVWVSHAIHHLRNVQV